MRLSALPDTPAPEIHAIIANNVCRNEYSPLSKIKSLNYGENILALNEATAKGANEAIMINTQGRVTCATIGNIFILKEKMLYTPPLRDGAMNGIARAILLRDYPEIVKEQTLTQDDLLNAEALYISNSIKGLKQIKRLNEKHYPYTQSPIVSNFMDQP